jgi:dipeptidyl-peptidase-4
MLGEAGTPARADAPKKQPVDAEMVARLPYPGTVVPAGFAFSTDGLALTYLKSESNSLDRVLWRVEVSEGATPKVVARPPGKGDTEESLTPEEKLRRERQRLRETGITQAVKASKADVMVVPLGGDLYLLEGDRPLRRLTETPVPELDPKPSPDGSKIAFVRGGELHVIDAASGRETRLTSGSEDGLTHGLAEFMAQEEMGRQTGYWWSPDGSKIAYQETDERHIPKYAIVHQGDEDATVEHHRYPFPGKANAKVRLGLVDASGGETTWLEYAAPDVDVYLARVDWEGPSRLLVQVLPRDQKSLRLVRIDLASGERTLLVEDKDDAWVNLHDDLRVVEGTGELLWSSERTGFRHLELRDRDGALVRTLTSGDWPVDAVVGLDSRRREAWFVAGRESPLGAGLYRVSLDGGPIEPVTREPGTHHVTVSPDGDHFVDVDSRLDRPPVTTLCDREGKVLATLDDAREDRRLADVDLTPPRLTQFKNRDGITLHGAYYPPKSSAPGTKAPLVVMVYGGPHVQRVVDAWDLTADLAAQYLAERGFAVWKCDNRGSSRRGHAFEAALNRDMGSVEVRDQVDGVRFVRASFPEVDGDRVGVTGGSYGGYMTLRCLTEAPDVFRAGVAVAPVTDWDGYDTCYTERYMGTPRDNPEGYRRASVLSAVYRLEGDVLVIHGLLDENVHFRHSARLSKALIRASKPFEFLPIPDERHSSRGLESRRYVAEKTAGFFERALRPAPSGGAGD